MSLERNQCITNMLCKMADMKLKYGAGDEKQRSVTKSLNIWGTGSKMELLLLILPEVMPLIIPKRS